MVKEFRILLLTGILILPLLSIFTIIPHTTIAQPWEPEVELSLVEENVTSTCNPDGSGMANFDGIVSITMNQVVRVVVTLTASDTWGTAVVSPSSILFDQSGEKTFGVSLQVPSDEEYNSKGTMTVSGKWSIYPGGLSGSVEPIAGNIIVGQLINFSISSSQQNVIVDQGSEKVLKVTIQNRGNYLDSYSINIKNYDELVRLGFRVELDLNVVEIPEGERVTFTIKIKAPDKEMSLLKHNVVIEVKSINGEQYNMPSKSLTYGLTIATKKSTKLTNNSIIWIIGLLIVILILLIIFRWVRKRIAEKGRYD